MVLFLLVFHFTFSLIVTDIAYASFDIIDAFNLCTKQILFLSDNIDRLIISHIYTANEFLCITFCNLFGVQFLMNVFDSS